MRLGACILPDWPAPAGVRALITSRSGGVSDPPFDSLNLALHVGDRFDHVLQNRAILRSILPADPFWLGQVKSMEVLELDRTVISSGVTVADAVVTGLPGVVCAVLSADELPLLLVSQDGLRLGAVQLGWRSLTEGLLEKALAVLGVPPDKLLAYMGPALGGAYGYIDAAVRERLLRLDARLEEAVSAVPGERCSADIRVATRLRLQALGLTPESLYGGDQCTFSERARFFSKSRDGATGRMASLIWRELI